MYHIRATVATAGRILQQLTHDHRTIALIVVVPCMLLALLRWLFDENMGTFNVIAPALLAIFPFTVMFIITSITTLRERAGGTMERLMAMPIGKLDFVLGYMLAFGLMAIIQAICASLVLVFLLGLEIEGPTWFLIVVALADALLGTALGIFVSAFAKTEFQAVQFMPALIVPQILVGGLLMPLEKMPELLETIAHFLPLTYAINALQSLTTNTEVTAEAVNDLYIVIGFIVGAILLAALTLKRRTK